MYLFIARRQDSLLTLVIKPLAAMLLPHRGGATIDSQHSFIAAYKSAPMPSNDSASASATAAAAVALSHADHGHALSLHTDDAEVTLNVCIGRDFQGTIHYTPCVAHSLSPRPDIVSRKLIPPVLGFCRRRPLLLRASARRRHVGLCVWRPAPGRACFASRRPSALARRWQSARRAADHRGRAIQFDCACKCDVYHALSVGVVLTRWVLVCFLGRAQIWCRSSQLRSAAVATEESNSEAP
jgi:hypothetical protein